MLQGKEHYIETWIREGEHQQQDFKFEISSARKIAKTLVAFANTDGGRLLIGVKDNGRITGIRSEEEYYMIDSASSMYCKPSVPFHSYKHVLQDGKVVLEIRVNPSEKKPHFAQEDNGKWKAYHRVKDENTLADYILLQVWKRQRRPTGTFIAYSRNEEKVMKAMQEKGSVSIREIGNAVEFRRRDLQHILVNLICLNVVRMEFRDNSTLFCLETEPDQERML